MTEPTTLTKIDGTSKAIANIKTIPEARKILAMAQGYVIAATKEYKAAQTLKEGKEDSDIAYDTALRAGGLRLNVEARLGELIKQEQDAGRLAKQGGDKQSNNVVTLKSYGLTKIQSSRAQEVAEYKDLIPTIVEKSTKTGDIPTRKALQKEIKNVEREKLLDAASIVLLEKESEGIIFDDCASLKEKLDDNSVDLFFTDPPYSRDTLANYFDLGELAQAKLKPGGLCLAYTPHPHLLSVLKNMSAHLDYWWIFSVMQTGQEPRIWKNKIWVGWKPILAFTKRPYNGRLTDTWFRDSFRGEGQDKRYHEWGQDIHEAAYWIEALTPVGGLVVDPFCGGGTTPLACKLTNRRWLATDSDPLAVATSRKRLAANDNKNNNA